MLARAIGQWLDKKVGLSFLYKRIVWLVFQEVGIVFAYDNVERTRKACYESDVVITENGIRDFVRSWGFISG